MFEYSTKTYQTRMPDSFDEPLSAYASLMGQVERSLFAEIAAGKTANSLKSSYIKTFQITARQFNGVRVNLEGKIRSILELQTQHITAKKHRISSLEKRISRIKKKITLHQKKRRLARLKGDLENLQKRQVEKKVPLCFGSRKLFLAQFELKENGYASHNEWKADWEKARSSEIFHLGSKEETSGNQSCTAKIAEDGSIELRVRLPDALFSRHGKYLHIPGIYFAHGHEAIVAAIRDCELRGDLLSLKDPSYKNHGKAISFRFKKDLKSWRVFASTDVQMSPIITGKDLGVIAVDINSDHLAVVELDRFGNPLKAQSISLDLYNKSADQVKALVGDASAAIISLCEKARKPLLLENLDFQKKKAGLREKSRKYARMLSAFAYSSIITLLKSRGLSKGVQVHSINPAFTSLIGRVKFAKRYGLTIHQAAAVSIGCRFLGVSERMPQGQQDIPVGNGDFVTLDLPASSILRRCA